MPKCLSLLCRPQHARTTWEPMARTCGTFRSQTIWTKGQTFCTHDSLLFNRFMQSRKKATSQPNGLPVTYDLNTKPANPTHVSCFQGRNRSNRARRCRPSTSRASGPCLSGKSKAPGFWTESCQCFNMYLVPANPRTSRSRTKLSNPIKTPASDHLHSCFE